MDINKSNFTGEWVFFKHEGMDEFLKEIGVAWLFRKSAAFMDYGTGGKTKHILDYDADKNVLKVVMISPRGTVEVEAPLDGSSFESPPQNPREGKSVKATAQWVEDDEGLCIHTIVSDKGFEAKRRIDKDGIMQVTQMLTRESDKQITCTRWFRRSNSPPS